MRCGWPKGMKEEHWAQNFRREVNPKPFKLNSVSAIGSTSERQSRESSEVGEDLEEERCSKRNRQEMDAIDKDNDDDTALYSYEQTGNYWNSDEAEEEV